MRFAAIVPLCMLLGCSADAAAQKEAQEAVGRDLKDPSSAQFRDMKVRPDYVCGEVNGKNGVGAYAGFTRFWFDRESKKYRIDPQDSGEDELSRKTQDGFDIEIEVLCK